MKRSDGLGPVCHNTRTKKRDENSLEDTPIHHSLINKREATIFSLRFH